LEYAFAFGRRNPEACHHWAVCWADRSSWGRWARLQQKKLNEGAGWAGREGILGRNLEKEYENIYEFWLVQMEYDSKKFEFKPKDIFKVKS
jgi:hypothetical protein